MKNKLNEQLLKEIISNALLEEYDLGDEGIAMGGGGGSIGGAAGMMGYNINRQDGPGGEPPTISQILKNTSLAHLFSPTADIFKSGLALTGAATRTALFLAHSTLEQLFKILIPGMETDFSRSRENYKNAILSLDNRYREVFLRNVRALKDPDMWLVNFLLNPSVVLGTNFAMKVPNLVVDIAEIIGLNPEKVNKTRIWLKQHGISGMLGLKSAQDEKEFIALLNKDKEFENKLNTSGNQPFDKYIDGIVKSVAVLTGVTTLGHLKQWAAARGLQNAIVQLETKIMELYTSRRILSHEAQTLKSEAAFKFKVEFLEEYKKDLLKAKEKAGQKEQQKIDQTLSIIEKNIQISRERLGSYHGLLDRMIAKHAEMEKQRAATQTNAQPSTNKQTVQQQPPQKSTQTVPQKPAPIKREPIKR